MFRKVRSDLDKAVNPVMDAEIRAKMTELMVVARTQIQDGK